MTEFRNKFKSKFYKSNMTYEEDCDYLFTLYGPAQYDVEDEIIKY